VLKTFQSFNADTLCSVYIAARSRTSPSMCKNPEPNLFAFRQFRTITFIVYLFRLVLDSVNGVSSTRATFLAKISLQIGNISQIKFVEDGTLMLLWFDLESSHLLNFPYIHDPEAVFTPNFIKIGDGTGGLVSPSFISTDQVTQIDLSDQTHHAGFIRHTFPPQRNLKPMTLQVNGKKGRRVVCVLYSDGLRYSVFDLDSEGDGGVEARAEDGEQGQSVDGDQIMTD